MIRVPAEVRRTLSLVIGIDRAFALMRDVPRWAQLFPHVESVEALPEVGETVYQWTMEPLGPPRFQTQTVYACRYHFDQENHAVTWVPVDGIGNARFSGGIDMAGTDTMTFGDLWLDATLEIPAPRFVEPLVRTALGVEFGRMTDRFLKRLAVEAQRV